jgi:hypothetical protein
MPASGSRPPRLAPHERFAAWVLTGPVGRVAAFAGDLGAAFGAAALRRLGLRRGPQ